MLVLCFKGVNCVKGAKHSSHPEHIDLPLPVLAGFFEMPSLKGGAKAVKSTKLPALSVLLCSPQTCLSYSRLLNSSSKKNQQYGCTVFMV